MKKLSIILACALLALAACTKSKEVHPEIGDGNDEIVTVGMKDVHVKYTRTDHAELSRVVLHYSLAQVQQFEAAEMTKQETFLELTLNDLLSDTLYDYYYELFSSVGETAITEQKTFHTQAFDTPEPPEPPTPPTPPVPGVPEGAINGLFTINDNGDQVYFSQGNLQYQASTNTWRFAEKQWDVVGNDIYGTIFENGEKCNNRWISSSYSGWIDLFGWGTSGYHDTNDPFNVNYQPWSSSESYDNSLSFNPFGYGPSTNTSSPNLMESSANYDWGYYNSISNGGNQNHQWRTLTREEWDYVVNNRNTISGMRYAKAQITILNYGIINGVILFPDNWNTSTYNPNSPNQSGASYESNVISSEQWNTLENAGAVFLPAAHGRRGTWMPNWNTFGGYWSTSYFSAYGAYSVTFSEDTSEYTLDTMGHSDRCYGHSVRLVQDAN